MYTIKYGSTFKKDLKSIHNRVDVFSKVKSIIYLLSEWKKLSDHYHDHQLQWKYSDYRECHILPNLLLVYKIDKFNLLLYCFRLWSHSDIFK